jgi:hypothetical protein
MPISHSQFYALPEGAEIAAMKKRFKVSHREVREGIEEPVLVDIESGDRLFGAIYICHLMHPERNAAEVLDPMAAAPEPVVADILVIETPAEPVFDPLIDVDHYPSALRDAGFTDTTLCAEIVPGAVLGPYPLAPLYAECLYA